MRRFVLLPLVLALAVAGCGGGSSGPTDKQKIETTVRDYFRAFAQNDPTTACSQLTAGAQQQIAKAAHAEDCSAALSRALQRPDIKQFRSGLRNARVTAVVIAGDKATAKVSAIGQSTTLPLRKQGSVWRIEGRAAPR